MGEPAGRADPQGTIARRQERIGVAILPDQTFATAIVTPISLDENISAGVRSHPNRAIGRSANEICLVGVQSSALPKVPGKALDCTPTRHISLAERPMARFGWERTPALK